MRRGRGGLLWLGLAAYLALLGWVHFVADRRFLRRIAVDVYSGLGDAMPRDVRPAHYELVLHVLLFVPLGWLALRATGRAAAWVALGCVWLVIMVELAQQALLDRPASPVEVVAASLGAILGAMLAGRRNVSERGRGARRDPGRHWAG